MEMSQENNSNAGFDINNTELPGVATNDRQQA